MSVLIKGYIPGHRENSRSEGNPSFPSPLDRPVWMVYLSSTQTWQEGKGSQTSKIWKHSVFKSLGGNKGTEKDDFILELKMSTEIAVEGLSSFIFVLPEVSSSCLYSAS